MTLEPIFKRDADIQVSQIRYALKGLSALANPLKEDCPPTEDDWYGISCLIDIIADLSAEASDKTEFLQRAYDIKS